jgi:hypothetical protein
MRSRCAPASRETVAGAEAGIPSKHYTIAIPTNSYKISDSSIKIARSGQLFEHLRKTDVPCILIYKMNSVFADPKAQHLGRAAPVQHYERGDIKVVRNGIKLAN